MKIPLKNLLLPSKIIILHFKKKSWLFIALLSLFSINYQSQQIANYVRNGGFEDIYSCIPPSTWNVSSIKYWSTIDTTKFCYPLHKCIGNVPISGYGFQNPKSGSSFVLLTPLCDVNFCDPIINRLYYRNKLKTTLLNDTIYCVKFYVNVSDNSPVGINSIGAFLSNSNTLDSINHPHAPVTLFTPQVQNNTGNMISDTALWVPISGTFAANGTESNLVIGNFKSDLNTMTVQIQPTISFGGCNMNLDHVSCIPINLPAYAGPNKWFIPGDSIYIGRESDVEIDESCIWYRMTSPTTSVTIDTIAGLWVKPVATTTYVVRQQLWCSGVKWDTVVVSLSGVGLLEMETIQDDLKLFPNPASDFLQIQYTLDISDPFSKVSIYNQLGQLILSETISFKNKKAMIPCSNLENGVYSVELYNSSGQFVEKRIVISR